MCGRYLYSIDIDEIVSSYNLDKSSIGSMDNIPSGEIYPGTMIPVILNEGRNTMKLVRWGFSLSGLKKELINIRMETALEKPVFKNSILGKRCIIPANTFFEWHKKGSSNVKYKIAVKDRTFFSMAGIYEHFQDAKGNIYIGAAVLTMPACNQLLGIHERMPVILNPEQENLWLSERSEEEIVKLQKDILWNSNHVFTTDADSGNIQLSFEL